MTAIWTTLALALAAPEMIPEQPTDLTGRTAPSFDAALLDEGSFTLDAHRGRPVVLTFWASWCGPCRFELPALDALAQERPDVSVLAINVDRDPAVARRFLGQLRVDLPVVLDPDAALMGRYQVASMPTTFLIDPNGTVKLVKVGYGKEAGLSELEAALAAVTR